MANSLGQAVSSKFYDGPVDGQDWAAGQPGLGDEYFVADQNAGRVRSDTTGTRTVEILAGTIGGHGVKDVIESTITVGPMDEPTSGSRWYLISAHRDWTLETPETQFIAVQGTATKAIPAARESSPGTKDDQPLALVQITKGQTQPSAIVDLRAIGYGGGTYLANDTMVMDYMSKPGYRFRIDGVDWVILLDGSRFRGANLPRSGQDTSFAPGSGGSLSAAARRIFDRSFGVKSFDRMVTVNWYGYLDTPATGTWRAEMELVDPATSPTYGQGVVVASHIFTNGSAGWTHTVALTAQIKVTSGQSRAVRCWIRRTSGSASSFFGDNPGRALDMNWTEVSPGNDW